MPEKPVHSWSNQVKLQNKIWFVISGKVIHLGFFGRRYFLHSFYFHSDVENAMPFYPSSGIESKLI